MILTPTTSIQSTSMSAASQRRTRSTPHTRNATFSDDENATAQYLKPRQYYKFQSLSAAPVTSRVNGFAIPRPERVVPSVRQVTARPLTVRRHQYGLVASILTLLLGATRGRIWCRPRQCVTPVCCGICLIRASGISHTKMTGLTWHLIMVRFLILRPQ